MRGMLKERSLRTQRFYRLAWIIQSLAFHATIAMPFCADLGGHWHWKLGYARTSY